MRSTHTSKIGIILSDSYIFYVEHLLQIAALCLPFIFVTTIFDLLMGSLQSSNSMSMMMTLALNILVYPIYTASLIQLMARRARKEFPDNSSLIAAALQQWAPLLMLKLAMTVLIGAGLSLLILPGLWIGVRLAFSEFYLVLFGMNPREALAKSFDATRNRFGMILSLLMITYVPILVLSLASDQLLQFLSGNDLIRLFLNTGWSFIGLFVHVVLFRAFMQVLSEKNAAAAI